MLGILALGLALFWGASFAQRFRGTFEGTERLAVGLALGLALALWLPCPFITLLGLEAGARAALAAVAALVAVEAWSGGARLARSREEWRRPPWPLAAVALGFAAASAFVVFRYGIFREKDGLYTAGHSYGDACFHWTLASSFLHARNAGIWDYPIYAATPLRYPFVPHLEVASLASLGLGLSEAFFATGWVGWIVLGSVLFALARRWSGRGAFAGVAACAIFFLAGGLGSFVLVSRLAAGVPLARALWDREYLEQPEQGLVYGNLSAVLFLPARSSVLGMALGAAALLLLVRAIEASREGEPAPGGGHAEMAAGTLAGLLPEIHFPSFLVVGFAGMTYALLFRRRGWRGSFWFLLPLALFSLPQLVWIRHALAADAGSMIHWRPGWESPSLLGWPVFWLRNAGVLAMLVVPAVVAAPSMARRLAAPFLVVFVAGNLAHPQPWSWDNMKFFAWCHLAAAVLAGGLLARLWSAGGVRRALALALLLAAILGGTLSVARSTRDVNRVEDEQDIAFGEFVRQRTPPRARFLTGSDHKSPVTVLAGRSTLLGFKGWLFSHGVSYEDRERDVAAIYRGAPRSEDLLRSYRIDYVIVGPFEREEYKVGLSETLFSRLALERERVGDYTLYRVR